MIFLFWLGLLLICYSYFIYPVVLLVANRFSSVAINSIDEGRNPNTISLIITAYNEQDRIHEKIRNSLDIDCSAFSLEIIVASDCSSDATDEIVSSYSDRGVKLVRANERLGKENAQWCAIQRARGEIVVFSDVATEIPRDALGQLVKYFSDDSIGAVSSEDRFISQNGGIVGEGAYVKYEMWLRKLESEFAGLVGLSGSFFAARKTICDKWDIHSPSDFNTALNCVRLGYRAVTAPEVLGYYADIADPKKEYQRKVRTVLRGVSSLVSHSEVLSFRRFGFFAFEVISHKLMRWLVPWFLILFLVVSLQLSGSHWFFSLSLLIQCTCYGLAIAAHFFEPLKANALVKIIYFFFQVNLAIADASLRFLFGQRMIVWQPSAR